jgi:hypothetical protein
MSPRRLKRYHAFLFLFFVGLSVFVFSFNHTGRDCLGWAMRPFVSMPYTVPSCQLSIKTVHTLDQFLHGSLSVSPACDTFSSDLLKSSNAIVVQRHSYQDPTNTKFFRIFLLLCASLLAQYFRGVLSSESNICIPDVFQTYLRDPSPCFPPSPSFLSRPYLYQSVRIHPFTPPSVRVSQGL